MSEYDAQANDVVRLADAIWRSQFRKDVNDWDAAMSAASSIYAAQIQADAIETFSEAVWERLGGLEGTIHHLVTGEEL
jgi:hypothetical protein